MTTSKLFPIAYLLFTLFLSNLNAFKISNDSKIPSPLILVPGDGGSRAYSNLDYHLFTVKALVWVNFEYMLFPSLLSNVMKLSYNSTTHKTSDPRGSQVFFPGWGSTETIEELDEIRHSQTTYFSTLVNSLIGDKFYIRNKTIRGAPYDFRKAPNENENFVADLKDLIEDTYKNSNNQRVVLLGHSLGSLYSLFFLDKMTMSWKKQHIRSFISVSGPLEGAVKALSVITSGESLGSPRNPIYFRDMQRSFPSSVFLLPKAETFGNQTIIITPTRNYSAYDYKILFKDILMPNGQMMYDDTKSLINGRNTPEGIDELYCIHGYGLPTMKQMLFTSFPDQEPKVINGDGDNTVNINSLEVCKKWKNVQYDTIKGADHMDILGIPEFLIRLKQILYRKVNVI